jgi:hypothetical protein
VAFVEEAATYTFLFETASPYYLIPATHSDVGSVAIKAEIVLLSKPDNFQRNGTWCFFSFRRRSARKR